MEVLIKQPGHRAPGVQIRRRSVVGRRREKEKKPVRLRHKGVRVGGERANERERKREEEEPRDTEGGRRVKRGNARETECQGGWGIIRARALLAPARGAGEAIWPLLMSDARNPYCHPSPTDPSVSRIS